MEDTDKWIIAAVIAVTAVVASSMMVSDWYKYNLKMRCIDKHGEWISETCIFRSQPPVDEVIVPKVHS